MNTKDTYKITETNYKTGYEYTWEYKSKTLSSAKRQATMSRTHTNTNLTIYKINDNGVTELMAMKAPILYTDDQLWSDFGLMFYRNDKYDLSLTINKQNTINI